MKNIKKIICFALITCSLLCLVACGKEVAVIEKLEDLQGRTVAAQMGTTHVNIVENDPILSTATLDIAATATDALAMLYSGKADGAVMDMFVAQKAVHQQEGIHVLDASLTSENYCIAFQQGRSNLIEKVNIAISNMKDNGMLDNLIFKWLQDDAKITFDQFWSGTDGTLKCLVATQTPPLAYIDDEGHLQGFEVEMMMMVARALNMKIEFIVTDFADLLSWVIAKEGDCAVGAISYTEDRARLVDFSDVYLNGGSVVVVRDADAGLSKKFSLKNSFYKTFVENDRWLDMLRGLGVTVIYVILTMSAAIVVAIAGFLLDYSGKKWIGAIYQKIAWFIGYLPMSLLLMFFYFAIFAPLGQSGFFAGWVAYTIAFGAFIFCDIKGAIEAIDNGQVEAAASMGYSKMKALKKIYLPQAIPQILESFKGKLTNLIKASSLLEFIAVVEFQTVADAIRAEANEPFLPLFVCAIVYWAFAYISSWLVGKIKLEGITKRLTEEELIKKYVED